MFNYTPKHLNTPTQSLESYRKYFLGSALPLRYATETITFPRLRNKAGQRQIYPKNTNKEINQGHKDEVCFATMKHPMKLPLHRFTWKKLRHHIRIKIDAKTTREWFFLTSAEDALVDFFILDPDLHPTLTKPSYCTELEADPTKTGMTPDDWAEAKYEFDCTVEQIRDLIPSDCITWTTSPGDIMDGQHRQGMYAIVKVSEAIPVAEMREKLKAWKAYHGLEVEDCWDKPYKNVRLPGQMWVEVCDPDTQQVIEPWFKPQDTLSTFCKHFDKATVLDIAHLDVPIEKPSFLPAKKAQTLPLSPPKRQSGYIPSPLFNEDYHEVRRSSNPWKMLNGAGIFTALAYKYEGNPAHIVQAAKEALPKLVRLLAAMPNVSEVDIWRANPMAVSLRRIAYYFDKFDPRLARGGYRRHKDAEDKARIFRSLHIDTHDLLRYAKRTCPVSYKDMVKLKRYDQMMKRFNGRIYCLNLYGSYQSLFRTYREYKRWFHKLRAILPQSYDEAKQYYKLNPAVDYDKNKHHCRQYCYTQEVLDNVTRANAKKNKDGGLPPLIKETETERESKELVVLHSLSDPRTMRWSGSALSRIECLNGYVLDYEAESILN